MKVKNGDVSVITVDKLKKRMRRRNNLEAWILLIPVVFILYTMVWRPTVMGFYWSVFRMQGYTATDFIGMDNFVRVLKHSSFIPVLLNTCKFVIWSMIIGFLPPLFIAAGLNVVDIHDLKEKTEKITGKPQRLLKGDKIVADVIGHDLSVQDQIYNVK